MEVTSSHHTGRGRYLTPKQVMDELQLSENVVYRELQYGFLKDAARRCGGQWRISADALDRVMASGAA